MNFLSLKRKKLVVLCEKLAVPVTKTQTKPVVVLMAICYLGVEPDELQERWEDIQEKEETESGCQQELEREKERARNTSAGGAKAGGERSKAFEAKRKIVCYTC